MKRGKGGRERQIERLRRERQKGEEKRERKIDRQLSIELGKKMVVEREDK